MSQIYYTPSDRYPKIVKLVTDRVLIYMASLLYYEEFAKDPLSAMQRIFVSDMQQGGDIQIKDAIKSFESFSSAFPFSVYSLSIPEQGEVRNNPSHGGLYYAEEVGRKVATWQMNLSLPMISYFNRADDFQRAFTRLYENMVTLTRLQVPISFNSISAEGRPQPTIQYDATFPIDVKFEIGQANYANEFQTYLTQNRIWDVKHDIKILYFDMALSEYLGDMTVQDMIVRLYDELDDGTSNLLSTWHIPDPPAVVSTSPPADATNIPSTVPFLTITWNNSMKENSTEFLINFNPPIFADFQWSGDSKTLTFFLYQPLQPNITYSVDIPENVEDMFGNNMEADYNYQFSTGA